MKTTKIILGLALAFSIFSCSKDDSNSTSELSEAKVSANIDMATEDVAKIVEDQYALQVNPGAGKNNLETQDLPSCATVTVDLTATTWTRTVVFDNCTLPNGNVLDGTIIVSGSLNFDTPSHTISYTFVDFHHNNILIEGNRTVVRSMQSTAAQGAVHPVANMSIDMTATFPNGNVYHRAGNRVRELIEGFDTPMVWADNVFSISGSWTTTFPAGTRTSTITTPLRVRANCPYIVRGVVEIVRNDNTAVLDYGTGECDNQATLTINGTTTTITLGN
ncbi:hypothetical protein L1S35_01565 [Flavobacterium sp. AS60]|uniref:hypothetical protein n=1 Tax=Flavobacterium anseongense TaxID=2910677 RepID=UPI001F39D9B4|nr:hypothetical protein [Flavobacterium sp. AS60]MCF6128343.1 hypothetical protein [Flavobacterium sp. AS60]